MKVIMTGGGTGGHIYPAVAIADKIKKENPDAEILFVGTKHGLEKDLVPKNGYDIEFITVSGFNRKNLFKNVKTVRDLAKGNHESKLILKKFRPDVVIGTGGYVCGPIMHEAAKMGIPTYIHEQNAFPGVTNKLLEKSAQKVFIAFPAAAEHFHHKDKLIVTGNPVRKSFFKADRMQSRRELGIPEDAFVLMSFGGSQGAGRINSVMTDVISEIQEHKDIFTVFVTGKYYNKSVHEQLEERGIALAENVRLLEYIDNMDKYIAVCDLIVSRSGALTVSEITVCGRAAILVPSPNVTGNHQFYNAKAVTDAGGAVLIEDKDFTADILKEHVFALKNDRKKLAELEHGSRSAAPGDAAAAIYAVIYNEVFK